jgi:hypothetical protein
MAAVLLLVVGAIQWSLSSNGLFAQEANLTASLNGVGSIELNLQENAGNKLRGVSLTDGLLSRDQLGGLIRNRNGISTTATNPLRVIPARDPLWQRQSPSQRLESEQRQKSEQRQELNQANNRFDSQYENAKYTNSQSFRDANVRPASYQEETSEPVTATPPPQAGFSVNQIKQRSSVAPEPTTDLPSAERLPSEPLSPEEPVVAATPQPKAAAPSMVPPSMAASAMAEPISEAKPGTSSHVDDQNAEHVEGADNLEGADSVKGEPKPDELLMYGPLPPPEMINRWQASDVVVQMSVDDLADQIQLKQKELENSITVDDDASKARLQQIASAANAIAAAKQNVSEEKNYQSQIAQLDTNMQSLSQQLDAPVDPLPVDTSLDVDAMQAVLKDLQVKLDEEESGKRRVQDRIEKRTERMEKIPVERIAQRQKMDQKHEEIQTHQAGGAEDLIELLVLRAAELQASTTIMLLDQEAKWHSLSRGLLPLQRDLHQKRIGRLKLETANWSNAINRRRQSDLETLIADTKRRVYQADPKLKALAERTAELAEARVELTEKIAEAGKEKTLVTNQFRKLETQRENLEKTIGLGSGGSSELIRVHQTLTRPYEGMARLRKLRMEQQKARISLLQLRRELEQFSDVEKYISDELKILNDVKIEKANTTLKAMAREAIEAQKEQIDELTGETEEYRDLLGGLIPQRESVLAEIKKTRTLVDKHALWTQSATPVGVEVLLKSRNGAEEFFAPSQWQALGQSVTNRITTRPYESVVGLLGLMIAFVVGRKLKG